MRTKYIPWTEAETQQFEATMKSEFPEIWMWYLDEERENGKTKRLPSEITQVFYRVARRDYGEIAGKESTSFLFANIRRKYRC